MHLLIALFGAIFLLVKCEDQNNCCWNQWSSWSCSVSCGYGVMTRTRTNGCGNPSICSYNVETDCDCDAGPCCNWGEWGNWSSCVNGYQTRTQPCVCDSSAGVDETCSGDVPTETVACCVWSAWSNTTSCSLNCGGGYYNRSRTCICGSSPTDDSYDDNGWKRSENGEGTDETDCEPTSPPPSPAYCNGSATEIVPCNTQPCCAWGNYSSWSSCNTTCGGYMTRVAQCVCTNPKIKRDIENEEKVIVVPPPSPCSGPQPVQQLACPQCCSFGVFSDWTQCSQPCGGVQYRRQLCQCPNSATGCSVSYNDSFCSGVPQEQTRPCNGSSSGAGCCSYGYLDDWSECTQCCGGGSKWRRQHCLCNGIDSPYSDCEYAGVPQVQTTLCNNNTCCALTNFTLVSCGSLDFYLQECVQPWYQASCECTSSSGVTTTAPLITQCPFTNDTISNPPIQYNRSTDFCTTHAPYPYPVNTFVCVEENSLDQCITWTTNYSQSGVQISVSPEVIVDNNTCAINEVSPSCWDGWTSWSNCCGQCDNAYQWRIQTSTTFSLGTTGGCRTPPSYQYRPCQPAGCCTWTPIIGNWSGCSVNCGTGVQWRNNYVCSCGNESLCRTPPPLEVRTCTINCCAFSGSSESTQCNATCNGTQWNSQKCSCNSSSGMTLSSTCGLASCTGVPTSRTTMCTSCTNTNIPSPLPPSSCNWTSTISNCTGTCPSTVGTQLEIRTCVCGGNPASPSQCAPTLPVTQTYPCVLNCSCSWTYTSDLSPCSAKCGTGVQYRTRSCTCPGGSPAYSNGYGSGDYGNDQYQYCSSCGGYTIEEFPCSVECPTARSCDDWGSSSDWPSQSQTNPIPCSSLSWQECLNTDPESLSPYEALSQQYIAASLNIDYGVLPSSAVDTAMTVAEELLQQCDWNEEQIQCASDQEEILSKFNSGDDRYTSYLDSSGNVIDKTSTGINSITPQSSHPSSPSLLVILIPTLVGVTVLVLIGALIFIKARSILVVKTV